MSGRPLDLLPASSKVLLLSDGTVLVQEVVRHCCGRVCVMQLIERDGHVRAEEGTVEVDTAVVIGAEVFVDVPAATERRRKMALLMTGRYVSSMLEPAHLLDLIPAL